VDGEFVDRLERAARGRRARIGVGVSGGGPELLAGLAEASDLAEIVLVGDPGPGAEVEVDLIRADDPASRLVELLAGGEVDGAVRGNLSATRVMRKISKTFEVRVRRLSLLALPDWSFFLAPVGIDEGDSISDRLSLAVLGAGYIRAVDLETEPMVSILSGGRLEDLGRSDRVDRTLAEGELVARLARDAGVRAVHRGILIETCRGDDLIVAPDGISGNLVFRTLMLLSGARGFGAPVLMDPVFVDSSRARRSFVGPVALAGALVAMKGR